MPLTTGTHLGPYEILAPLGAGGMGEVYRARDTRLGREIAIKVLPAAFAQDADRLARFEREAKAVAALSHPNILSIFDTGTHDGVAFVVTELLDGETLGEHLKTGALPVRKAVEIAVQMARGLAAAHAKGIVHRDLKPENVFLLHDGQVKILDFGLARQTLAGSGATETVARLTDPGIVMGTVSYMAPEQVRGQAIDGRTDLFALGAVLYEMLSGQRAFRRDTSAETMTAILRDDPPELAGSRPDLSPALDRIVRHCLEKNPAERFQTARDIAFALESFSGTATASGAKGLSGSPPIGWRAGWRGTRSVVGAAILGGAAAGAFATAIVFRAVTSTPTAPPQVQRLSMIFPDTLDVRTNRSQGAISPDGRLFAFIGGEPGSTTDRIWLRAIDSTAATPLGGTDHGNFPFWSPDSRALGFFADGKLKKVSASGGEPEVLCDAATPRGGTWNATDVIVFAPNVDGPLMRVSANGGEPKAVTVLDAGRGELAHRFPSFLPDGRHFLFSVLPARGGQYDAYVGSIDTPGRQFVVSADSGAVYADPGYLLFSRRNRIMAQRFDSVHLQLSGEASAIGAPTDDSSLQFVGGPALSASRTGVLAYLTAPFVGTELVWADPSGKTTQPVAAPPGYVLPVSFSRDDKRAVLRRRTPDGDTDTWILDIDRGGLSRFTEETRTNHDQFVWSPDGRQLAFASFRNGRSDIVTKPTAGSAGAEVPIGQNEALDKFPTDWSRDDRYLVYSQIGTSTNWDIWILPLQGSDRTPRPYVQTPGDDCCGVLSPDGRWLGYATNNDAGRWDIYVQSFPSPGNPTRVAQTYIRNGPVWNGTGTLIGWVDPDGTKIWVADVLPGPEFHIGPPRVLQSLPQNLVQCRFTSDFRRVICAVSLRSTARPSVTIITDWVGALKKQ